MNVVKESLESQVALLKVTISEGDYKEAVAKQLKAYKKKANVPGFRPGMVPMGIVEKMYKKGVTAEESYKLASESIYKFLEDNKIKTLGDPIPSDTQKEIDFENNTEFEFAFEVAEYPAVNLDLASIELKKYDIVADDELLQTYKDGQLRRFGKLVDKEVVTSDEALEVTLDNEDMAIENAYVGLISMSEEERAPFIGKQIGDSFEVNVNELYKSPSQRASILSLKEEELADINPIFTLRISRIRKFENPELTAEFFAEAYPEGDITTEEQFTASVKAQLESNLAQESNVKMVMDGKKVLLDAAALTLPDTFLKKWLLVANQGKFTAEEIEAEYDMFADYTKWSCICSAMAEQGDYKVEIDEVSAEAKAMAAMQFAQYGIATPTDEMLDNYTSTIMKNQEEVRRLYESVNSKKCVEYVATKAKVVTESISYNDFITAAQAQ